MTDKVPKLLFDALAAIHGYDAVDDEIVYLTVTDDLDELKADLTQLLAFRGFGIEPLTPTHVALGS